MANVEKIRGKFRVRYTDENGKRRSSPYFDFEYEAQAWRARGAASVAAIAPEIRNPMTPRPVACPTIGEYAATYLQRQTHLADSTLGTYTRAARELAASRLGAVRMTELHRDEVQLWMADMRRAKVGVSTQIHRVGYLRRIVNDAIAGDRVGMRGNPMGEIKTPKADLRVPRTLNAAEEAALFAETQPSVAPFFLAALEAGLRWGEIAGLRGDAVRFDAGHIKVYQVVPRRTAVVRPSTKSHHIRNVPLTPTLAEALAPLARFRSGLLFTEPDGSPLNYDRWYGDVWEPTRAAAGLSDPQPRFHDLRHTYGTRLVQRGVPRSTVAKVMGHADESTTAIYVHDMDSDPMMQMVIAALAKAS
jgi:integrase